MKNPYKHTNKLRKWAKRNNYPEVLSCIDALVKAMRSYTNPLLSDLQLLTPSFYNKILEKYGSEIDIDFSKIIMDKTDTNEPEKSKRT